MEQSLQLHISPKATIILPPKIEPKLPKKSDDTIKAQDLKQIVMDFCYFCNNKSLNLTSYLIFENSQII